jgi:Anti-sigma regulatory factor (Ser/Thr protein kinase)
MAQRLTNACRQQLRLEIGDSSGPAEVRRTSTRLAEEIGFSEVETSNVAIVTNELATNLVKHAKHGQIVLGALHQGETLGLEVLSLDQGPGISNIAQCMRDGYSSAGSLGNGLGAVARLAYDFDIYSLPGKGTAVLARLWAAKRKSQPTSRIDFGVSCLPMAGEEICGDGWAYEALADSTVCMVADGLGHGPQAALAADEAVATLREYKTKSPAELMEKMHGVLRSTRGAALSLAQIRHDDEVLRFCGLGNISGSVITNGTMRRMASNNGTAGVEASKIAEFSYPWNPDSLLIMHSDGLLNRWDLEKYPGLTQRHPSLIAAVLYRDFYRGRDDVTVLTGKTRMFGST